MKFFLLLVTLMPLVWAAEFEEIAELKTRSISSQVVDAIEAAKEQMPCGFPGLGIPPMAPFKMQHKEININTKGIAAFGQVNNTTLYGLNNFDIVELKVNAFLSRINFLFNWKHLYAITDYELFSEKGSKGLRRTGYGKLALKDLVVRGVIKYSLGLVSGKVSLKEMKIYVSLGEVKSDIEGLSKIKIINKKLNRLVEEWIMLAINDNTNNIAEMTNSMAVPIVNEMLKDKSLSDLLGMIGGNGEPSEKEPCIPPEEDSADYGKYFL